MSAVCSLTGVVAWSLAGIVASVLLCSRVLLVRGLVVRGLVESKRQELKRQHPFRNLSVFISTPELDDATF